MVKKVGQRKFLLKYGYTDEELDKMSPYIAHEIIGDIEKANRVKKEKQKQKITFAIQECAKCQYKLRCEECCYNEKDITKLLAEVRKETAETFVNLPDSDILVVDTQEYGEIEVVSVERLQELAKSLGVEIKE